MGAKEISFICAFLAGVIIVTVHVWNDAHGDNKKFNDIIVLSILAALFALGLRWLFDTHVAQSLALMAGIHVASFDYIVVYFLRKNGVIRESAKVFTYTGSKGIDLLWAKVHPVLRLVIRLAVFAVAAILFLS